MNEKLRFYFLVFFCWILAHPILKAQTENCLQFEGLEAGTVFGREGENVPGDLIYEENEVFLRLRDFVYFDGSQDFINLFVFEIGNDPFFPAANGSYLFPSNINLEFDFTAFQGAVSEVCFDFSDGGGEENISVNGSPIVTLNTLLELSPEDLPEGITFDLDLVSNDEFQPQGSLCIRGNIEKLIIGGQEFGIDNVCYSLGSNNEPCAITDLFVEPQPCTPNGVFYVDLELNAQNPSEEGFSVAAWNTSGQEEVFGPFSYDEPFVTIGPFQGDGSSNYTFLAFDKETTTCQDTFVLDPINCFPDCSFDNFETEILNCTPNSFDLKIDLTPVNSSNVGFDVYIHGEFVAFFTYDQLPAILEGLPTQDQIEIKICDNDNPGCCITELLEIPTCTNTGSCIEFEEINPITYGASNGNQAGDIIYTENDVPMLLLPLQRQNWLSSFESLTVYNEANSPDFPIGSGQFLFYRQISSVFDLSGLEHEVESLRFDFRYGSGTLNFGVNGGQILILDELEAGVYGIAPGIELTINFPFEDPALGQAILTGPIHTFLLGGDNLYVDNLCLNIQTPCTIDDLIIETTPCDENNQFFATLDFSYEQTSDSFTVWINGNEIATHVYADLPLQLGPFTGPLEEALEFKVIDLESPDCYASTILESINCIEECVFENIVVEPICISGTPAYTLLVDFDFPNPNAVFEYELGNGQSGEFFYSEVPLELEVFITNTNPEDFIRITQINSTGTTPCTKRVNYENPCFVSCEIFDLVVTPSPCGINGEVSFEIDFGYEGTQEDFDVTVNGQFVGDYNYADLPIQVGTFPADGETIYEIKVYDRSEACFASKEVGPIQCENEGCEFGEVIVENHPCEEGQFLLDIEVNANNPGNLGYFAFVDGQVFGPFSYNEQFITVGPFIGDGLTIYDILILDIANANEPCYGYAEIGPIDCDNSAVCDIRDIVVEPIACTGEGQFSLELNFIYENPASARFKVSDFYGNILGTYAYADLPITIENFPNVPSIVGNTLLICDAESPNCCAGIDFEDIDCTNNEPCDIRDVVVDPLECTGEGQYSLVLNFIHENDLGVGFDVFASNGQFIGYYTYDQLPLTINNFPERPDNEYDYIKICDNDNPDCCKEMEFMGPDCSSTNDDCSIANIYVEPRPCTPNGIFYIDLEFDFENPGDDGFKVLVYPGEIETTFNYGEPFYTVGPIPANSSGTYSITVLDKTFPNCGNETSFEWNCSETECSISDLSVYDIECNTNGTYDAVLDFNHETANNDSFELYNASGELIGSYGLAALPIQLMGLGGDIEQVDTLKVCINDQLDCCQTIVYEIPNCIPAPEELVWPGDADFNNIANHFDLLYIGRAFGTAGPERSTDNIGIAWQGLEASPWNLEFVNGLNYKHADCNGDGFVDEADTEAIRENYNLVHGPVNAIDDLPNTSTDPPIFVEFPDPTQVVIGEEVAIPIILGSEEQPVEDLYGVAFTIEYDIDLFVPGSVSIEYMTSWFGDPNVNQINLDKIFGEMGAIEMAISRTDQNNVSGFGQIAWMRGIIDDIEGLHEIDIEHPFAQKVNGALIPLQSPAQLVQIGTEDPITLFELKRNLKIFPNPTDDLLNIYNHYQLPLDGIEILDVNGRFIMRPDRIGNGNTVSLKELPKGVYLVKITMGQYIVFEKFVKM